MFNHISLNSSWSEILKTKVAEKYHAVYEIMWKDNVDSDGPQMTIWRMRVACWIKKATGTRSECVIPIAVPRQQWLHERPSLLRLYVHTLPVLL